MRFHVHVLLWFPESDGVDARSPKEVTHQRDSGRPRHCVWHTIAVTQVSSPRRKRVIPCPAWPSTAGLLVGPRASPRRDAGGPVNSGLDHKASTLPASLDPLGLVLGLE